MLFPEKFMPEHITENNHTNYSEPVAMRLMEAYKSLRTHLKFGLSMTIPKNTLYYFKIRATVTKHLSQCLFGNGAPT